MQLKNKIEQLKANIKGIKNKGSQAKGQTKDPKLNLLISNLMNENEQLKAKLVNK